MTNYDPKENYFEKLREQGVPVQRTDRGFRLGEPISLGDSIMEVMDTIFPGGKALRMGEERYQEWIGITDYVNGDYGPEAKTGWEFKGYDSSGNEVWE